jgi:hypothetical protein
VLKSASVLLLAWGMISFSQEKPAKPESKAPPMRVNILNVCAPSEPERKEMEAALGRVPQRPSFGRDYEITRGYTTGEDGTGSNWVRIRREFPKAMPLQAVQFSYVDDPKSARETAVFYAREAKDVMQVALEAHAAAGSSATAVLAADTPSNHIRIERFGKQSLVLARCPAADQSAYEPLFRTASQIMAAYRQALGAKQIVPAELGRGPGGGHRPAGVKPMTRSRAPESKP